MKHLLLAVGLLSLPAFASPQRDALLGTYEGSNCHLIVRTSTAVRGETDIAFTDEMSERTLRSVGRSLELQLARGAETLVFDHARQSLGDVTTHLEIRLDTRGRPVSMTGTVDGWGHAKVNCRFR